MIATTVFVFYFLLPPLSISQELKRILPALCRTDRASLEIPKIKILPTAPDLKKEGLRAVKLEADFTSWKYLRVCTPLPPSFPLSSLA